MRYDVFEYMTTKEAAEKWEISQRRVQVLCIEGRIAGARKYATVWAIPKDVEKSRDIRVIRGKFIEERGL